MSLRGDKPLSYDIEWVSVTIESKLTMNSADFDPIFLNLMG